MPLSTWGSMGYMTEQKSAPQGAARPAPPKGKILVLGGGIVGVTTAYSLLCRGFDVTLIERNSDVAEATSRANAGLVSVGGSQPWNAPNVPLTVLKTLGRADSPYLFRLRAFPAVIPWGLRFLMHCRTATYDRSCRASAELVTYSLDRFGALVDREGLRFDRQQNGVLKYFQDAGALAADHRSTAKLADAGLDFRQLSRDETVALEPTLAPQADRIAGGLYFPKDESGDASAFAKALAERCRALGATILTNTTISAIESSNGRISAVMTDRGALTADHYVLCAGPAAALLARPLGLNLPIYPAKGYSVTIETNGSIALPKVPFLDWGRKVCVTRFGNRIRATGYAEFGGYDLSLTPSRIQTLHRSLIELFPALEGATSIHEWAGLRPITPDGLPILGQSPIENLFLNVGHGPQGWGLSAGCAAILADVITGRSPDVPIGSFAYSRNH
ncbi:MAG: FAD-dependent oxidoreductase [Sphingomonadales bacterium]|nr:MAG: FAD-dependent oxidoreductase [Sphingomonadales bacterium]